jgi:chemotaxis protein methyltransferase CheR
VQGVRALSPLEFEFLLKLVKSRSGIVLRAGQPDQLESRLRPLLRRTGLVSLGALVATLRRGDAEPVIAQVVEALATRETWFFRDRTPFDDFTGRVVPALLASRSKERRIRIWCAAASTGQEPYSVAISLAEMARQLAGWQVDIVATDLSSTALEKAATGIYSAFEVQRGLPVRHLVKYFARQDDGWRISPDIRAMVQFRPFNLLDDFAALGRFDVVFCRNVLGGFDPAVRRDVLCRIARLISLDGTLVLGAGETAGDGSRPLFERGVRVSHSRPSRARPPLAVIEATGSPATRPYATINSVRSTVRSSCQLITTETSRGA